LPKDSGEVTLLALNWQKEQRDSAIAGANKAVKEREVEEVEESGGHAVSMAAGTPPDRQRLNSDDIDKRITELRTVSRGRGSAAEQARVEIYKLERQRQHAGPIRARV